MSGDADQSGASTGSGARRLPPPVFPPGSGQKATRSVANNGQNPRSAERALEEALISPDEPLPQRGVLPEDAFISPDDPIPHRDPGQVSVGELEEGDVVVSGMGDNTHMASGSPAGQHDPYVRDLTDEVVRLAEALKQKGEAGLRARSGMSRFEATLRAYCVGYLVGRRASEEED
ncbi:MAG: hypothetical protein OEZ65_06050 [Gemmatimonadota bacterium]|nr:hypothetical protein [Gemmatimonadota bacterium]MDH5759134.1 hypothetical protein [Gemmatimonadota bacterium]